LRDWKGLVFDLGLVTVAASFLGIIFYGQRYIGPLLQEFPHASCPDAMNQISPQICLLLSYPQNDPFPGQASLSILALSLCAVASSLRVFGAETAQLKREVSSGACTEAYYLGKSLAHMPIILVAPMLFIVIFYSLSIMKAPVIDHYFLLFLVYFNSAGIAYGISVVIQPSSSQLVGILIILSNMTFSGANPTLVQLSENRLIPHFLVDFAYLSFIRWAQELHYLLEIAYYEAAKEQNYLSMGEFYGYSISDQTMCWEWLIIIALVYRTFAYLVLVKQEE